MARIQDTVKMVSVSSNKMKNGAKVTFLPTLIFLEKSIFSFALTFAHVFRYPIAYPEGYRQ